MVLGFANVRTLVTAAAIIARFPAQACAGFNLPAFWRHSIGVACGARVLSARTGLNPNTAFICGLLHDIGRVLLATSYPGHHAEIAAYRASHDCLWNEAELEVIGLDHAAIGAALAARWNFPELIQQAVAGHHQPDAEGSSPLAVINHVSDAICHALDTAIDAAEFVPVLSARAWRQTKLGDCDLQSVFAEIERMIEGASVLAGTASPAGASRARAERAEA
jgi:putative nucleotidyltransferase with HDIG domain